MQEAVTNRSQTPFDCVYTQLGYEKEKGKENRSEENSGLHRGFGKCRCSFPHTAKFGAAYPVAPRGSCSQSIFDRQAGKASCSTYVLLSRLRAVGRRATGTHAAQALRSGCSLGPVPRGQDGNSLGSSAVAVISNSAEKDAIAFGH